MSKLYFFLLIQTNNYHVKLFYDCITRVCLELIVFTVLKIAFIFDVQLSIKILSLLREDDENDTTIFTVYF